MNKGGHQGLIRQVQPRLAPVCPRGSGDPDGVCLVCCGVEMSTDIGVSPGTVLGATYVFIEHLLCCKQCKLVYICSLLFEQNNSLRGGISSFYRDWHQS